MRRLLHQSTPVLLVALGLFVGCGPKELAKKEVYPVRGKLVRQGEPVKFAGITFKPTEEGNPEASAVTKEDGTFELRTYSNTEPDGAVPGQYKVEVVEYEGTRGGPLPKDAEPSKIPVESRKPAQTYEVKSEDNEIVVELP